MPQTERIPFAEAISEPLLLRDRFEELSLPQRAALKMLYGLPLSDIPGPDKFSELDYWDIFHERCRYDGLGYPQWGSVWKDPQHPYEPREHRQAVLVVGRRGGKTDSFASTIVAYEATCGGHEGFVRKGQELTCFQIAQDLRMARYSLHFIRATLESSPVLKKEIRDITADTIRLSNGATISCVPPTTKSVRGFAPPVVVMDEVGVWYQESDNANPDFEVYRAVTPGMVQFPQRKLVLISTPWNKNGLLWRFAEAGTEGRKLTVNSMRRQFAGTLVLTAPTATLQNPRVTREYLEEELQRDSRAYEREFLAVFQDSISGFLPPDLLDEAVVPGLRERPPLAQTLYIAAMDPAFKRDAWTLSVVHNETGMLVQDAVRKWEGSLERPLSPEIVLQEMVPLLRNYGITVIYTDQYHLESLQVLCRQFGFQLIGIPFTARSKAQIYGNLQQLVLQKRLRLLDHPETVRELKQLERQLTTGGHVQIGAPPGAHDDLASVIALGCAQAMPFGQARPPERITPQQDTIHAHCLDQVRRKWGPQEVWE